MYLARFNETLREKWKGSLVSTKEAVAIEPRAKEYLHRLSKLGLIERISWGWYYVPAKEEDVWSFLKNDKGFKVVIKQTAASLWNYDFVHRNVYRLAVTSSSYKRALERFAETKGWLFEVEYHKKIPYEYVKVDGLFVESPESCLVNCVAEWSFLDAFALLYFRRNEVSLKKVKGLSRWKRIARTDTRVWSAVRYACQLFNERLGKRLFKVRRREFSGEVKQLVEEAVEKVLDFA